MDIQLILLDLAFEMSVLKRVFDKSLRVTKSFLKSNKKLELKPSSVRLKKVAGVIDGIAKPFQLAEGVNLNFMITEKTKILLHCEKEFNREIPSYKLRDMKTLKDIINYFATPIAKVYVSGLPNLENNITEKTGISNIKIYEDIPLPNPDYEKKFHLRVY